MNSSFAAKTLQLDSVIDHYAKKGSLPSILENSRSRHFIFSTTLTSLYSGRRGYRNMARSQLNSPRSSSRSAESLWRMKGFFLLSRITRLQAFLGFLQEQDFGLTKTLCSTRFSQRGIQCFRSASALTLQMKEGVSSLARGEDYKCGNFRSHKLDTVTTRSVDRCCNAAT